MAGIDLTGPRARVAERVFLDRCSMFRDPATSSARPLNDDTGDPVEGPPNADESTLVVGCPCVVRQNSAAGVSDEETAAVTWTISLAYDVAPEPLIGDRLVLTTSADPTLLGLDLFVREVETGTLRVSRRVTVGRRVGAYGTH